ncbi:dual specificity protein kinase TTK isoform X2 [Ascaphus truei]
MDDEDISERKLKIASILDRVKSFKTKYGADDNWTDELTFTKVSSDTTEHSGIIGHLTTAKTPEEWQSSLVKLEDKGLPQTDRILLNKLIDNYSQAVGSLPAEKHSRNESYAQILVRFAELKGMHDPEEAREQFQLARLNCKKFAFVHTAFAQFELSQGNFKKSKQILQKGTDCCAVPTEMMEIAMKNLHLKKQRLISQEDKDYLSVSSIQSNRDATGYKSCTLRNSQGTESESSGELSLNMRFSFGEKSSSPEEGDDVGRKPFVNLPNKTCTFGRVPIQSITSPDFVRRRNGEVPSTSSVVKRQPFSAMQMRPILPSLSKPQYSRDEDSHNLGNIKISKNSSPYSQQSNEDSLEVQTQSSVILCKGDSSLTLKRNEDIPMADNTNTHRSNLQESYTQPDPEPRIIPSINIQQSDPPKASSIETTWRWKVPETPSDIFLTKGKEMILEPNAHSVSKRVSPLGAALKRSDPVLVCGTPVNKPQEDYMNCFRTPVVKNDLGPMSQISTPYDNRSSHPPPQTPANSLVPSGCFQISTPLASNECIVVKGRAYAVLKQIGTGGSSKVFQVMDEKKHLYAIKYVNLEEADQQTIESYQNEISHLNKLQQHSDKIIRLYDYEIADQHIYMVMECGNLDLNSWLRKKKTINLWERKSYWKNMLEAVYTIHQHGIVHSDLKPANFLIVDGMLKLIDFGIANQIQPDVTSIVKDSQVGTINYMPPEAIKDTTSYGENGKPRSKISPKGDVWSLGCILYCMTYGKTPFQHITNQITKLHAILDPSYEIEIPDIPERDLQDVLRKCLVRSPKQRISIADLLIHPYVQIQVPSQTDEEMQKGTTAEMKRILGQLIGLNSPNSISRAARSLYDQCNSGKSLDLCTIAKPVNQNTWSMK